MDARRFDAFARFLARALPRRGVLRTLGAAPAAVAAARLAPPGASAQAAQSVALPCEPCRCVGDACDCCLIGITGGGIVRTAVGDANLVLFATRLGEDAPQEAAGFVRWLDPNAEGGLSLESVGPIAYDWPEGEEHLRNVRGIMSVNGQSEEPFLLEVFDAGPDLLGEDTARLLVGASIGESSASGFAYEAAGQLVGGDLQLLDSVAPITPPA
jgi:hypothetical protein